MLTSFPFLITGFPFLSKRMADSFEKDTYVGTSSYGNRYVYNTYVSA